MGNFWSWFKHLFSKTDNSINTDNSHKVDNSIKVKQINKGSNTIDNSQNKTYIEQLNNYVETNNKFIALKMRWYHLVPHKIVEKKNGIDCYSVLEPCDENFVDTRDFINLSDSCNTRHGLYILCKANPNIINFGIENLTITTDKNDLSFELNKNIAGLLDRDTAFVVNHKDLTEGSGEVLITIFYTRNSVKYNQRFIFSAKKDAGEFVLREYNNPEVVS